MTRCQGANEREEGLWRPRERLNRALGATGVPNLKLISTVSTAPLVGDFGVNCRVDTADLGMLVSAWLTSYGEAGYNEDCDISEPDDDMINLSDFAVFAENWLAEMP